MEGTLYKSPDGEHYYLEVDGKIFAEIGGHPLKSINQSLSIKNCEAIENGYDLDKLADEYYKRLELVPHKGNAYISGFQKALSIFRDRKFSEGDMLKAIEYGIQSVLQAIPGMTSTQSALDSWKSPQQTEWDVEIVTKRYTDVYDGFNLESKREPKLDTDGCLILKRL
jgi:hypothetical protein